MHLYPVGIIQDGTLEDLVAWNNAFTFFNNGLLTIFNRLWGYWVIGAVSGITLTNH